MGSTHRKTILLIENITSVPQKLAKDLENVGYRVIRVDSGKQVLDLPLDTLGIDLILTDIEHGDGLGGAPIAEQILQEQNLPLVFILNKLDPHILETVENITTYGFVTRKSTTVEIDSFIRMVLKFFESVRTSEKEEASRHTAENELTKLKNEYETVFQGTQDAMFLIAVENEDTFRFIRTNKSHQIATGVTSQEIRGKTPFELLGEEEGSKVNENYARCLRNRRPISYEEALTFPSGIRTWSTTLTPIFGDDATYIVGSAIDITERKQAEDALKESQARLEAILEYSPLLISEVDVDGRYLLVNAVVDYYLKISPAQMIGKKFDELLPAEMAKRFKERLELVIRERKPMTVEDQILTQFGIRNFLTTLFPLWNEAGDIHSIGSIAYDITDRQMAETALKESEYKYRLLFETMTPGVVYQAADGTITSPNPSAERVLGLTSDQMMGKTSMDPRWGMILEDGTPVRGSDHPTMVALRTGEQVGPVTRGIFVPEKQEYVWLSITAIPLFKPGEVKPYEAYATFDDVTERKRYEQALQKSLTEKNVLLSEIHHRVKNNMAVISSMITLQSQFFRRKDPESMLQDISVRIKSMAMVHEMVYEHQNFAEIDVGALLKRLSEYLETIYQSDNQKVAVEIRADNIMLNLNKSIPFTLLVSELLTNAFKHAFRDQKTGLITVKLKKNSSGYWLLIQDNGVGVSSVDQLKNNDSFGWAIIQGLAQQLQGEFEISSPQEGGVRVEIQFPGA